MMCISCRCFPQTVWSRLESCKSCQWFERSNSPRTRKRVAALLSKLRDFRYQTEAAPICSPDSHRTPSQVHAVDIQENLLGRVGEWYWLSMVIYSSLSYLREASLFAELVHWSRFGLFLIFSIKQMYSNVNVNAHTGLLQMKRLEVAKADLTTVCLQCSKQELLHPMISRHCSVVLYGLGSNGSCGNRHCSCSGSGRSGGTHIFQCCHTLLFCCQLSYLLFYSYSLSWSSLVVIQIPLKVAKKCRHLFKQKCQKTMCMPHF